MQVGEVEIIEDDSIMLSGEVCEVIEVSYEEGTLKVSKSELSFSNSCRARKYCCETEIQSLSVKVFKSKAGGGNLLKDRSHNRNRLIVSEICVEKLLTQVFIRLAGTNGVTKFIEIFSLTLSIEMSMSPGAFDSRFLLVAVIPEGLRGRVSRHGFHMAGSEKSLNLRHVATLLGELHHHLHVLSSSVWAPFLLIGQEGDIGAERFEILDRMEGPWTKVGDRVVPGLGGLSRGRHVRMDLGPVLHFDWNP